MPNPPPNAEQARLAEDEKRTRNWKRWGPYLSERQWGTVGRTTLPTARAGATSPTSTRAPGPTDGARTASWGSRTGNAGCAFQWRSGTGGPLSQGEALRAHERGGQPRRGRQGMPFLHGLDADALVDERPLQVPPGGLSLRAAQGRGARKNPRRSRVRAHRHRHLREGRYFDVAAEYAKADTDDICIRITAANRGPERATLHLLPTLWFRNTWSWGCRHEGCG
jgi:hypothetical protein